MMIAGKVLIATSLVLAMFGMVGLFRFRSFYARVLITSNIDSAGMILMMIGGMLHSPTPAFALKICIIAALALITGRFQPMQSFEVRASAGINSNWASISDASRLQQEGRERSDMTGILEIMMVVGMIVLAFMTVQTIRQRRAVIYLGAFSLIASFAYLAYNAPDVAIAEAVIGCTLSTVLFLIAMKKYRVITIYYVQDEEDVTSAIKKERRELTRSLENFLLERGYEPQCRFNGV